MTVESDYRGYRIEVVAFQMADDWDADVRIRRVSSRTTTCAGHLSCRKPTAEVAEESAAMCARQWVDRHAQP